MEYQILVKSKVVMNGNHLAQILEVIVAIIPLRLFCKLIFVFYIESNFQDESIMFLLVTKSKAPNWLHNALWMT